MEQHVVSLLSWGYGDLLSWGYGDMIAAGVSWAPNRVHGGAVVEFRLLGPVEVTVPERIVEVGPPQRCAVLAALAVDASRPVMVETLIDRVWGEQPPQGARRALHAHVTRLRRLLEQMSSTGEPTARLLRRSGGYMLDVDPDRVDLHRFRRLVNHARDRHRDGSGQVVLLREALGLWRGEPLAGLAGQWVTRTRQGWRQEHMDVILSWASADLLVGNATTAIGSLTGLIDEHPLLEPLVAALMRALHAAGHAARALDLYAITRKRLVEELGPNPAPNCGGYTNGGPDASPREPCLLIGRRHDGNGHSGPG